MNNHFYNNICTIVGKENIRCGEVMSKHTSIRVGGPADYFITPVNEAQIHAVIDECKAHEIEFFVVGNGTNLLVSDEGYRGAVIQIQANFQEYQVCDGRIKAGAGILLSKLAKIAAREELAGFEFAAGIPGTLGGAVVMNAGAYGGEIKDVLVSANVYKPGIGVVKLNASDLELGYRTSLIKHTDWIVVGAEIQLENGNRAEIEGKIEELRIKRAEKQPLEYPSAGSAFKRPEGHFAGKLIMDSNLRGFQIGGAQVSEKHCGFIINKGGAKASDVKKLMDEIIKMVYQDAGVMLVPEIMFLGKF